VNRARILAAILLLGRAQRDAIQGALEDAATLRLERLDCASSCLECALAPDGSRCGEHAADAAATQAYDNLAVRLQGRARRRSRKAVPA